MSDSKIAYGDPKTGKIIPGRLVRKNPDGSETWTPDVESGVRTWGYVPGVWGPDGKFHPGDRTKKPAGGVSWGSLPD